MNWASERALHEIADHYGTESQLNILQEECAELIQAVSKYRRGESIDLLAEEIADVEIMIAQIKYLLCLNTLADIYVGKKIKRQKERMSNNDK